VKVLGIFHGETMIGYSVDAVIDWKRHLAPHFWYGEFLWMKEVALPTTKITLPTLRIGDRETTPWLLIEVDPDRTAEVCGGIAQAFGLDAQGARVAFRLVTLFGEPERGRCQSETVAKGSPAQCVGAA
jgi:hypothetical protein